jgi:hypothetical protein
MNTLHRLSIVIVFFLFSVTVLQAQYTLPSFEAELEQENTTFEETQGLVRPFGMEERQLVVQVEDNQPTTNSWAIVTVYSLDGADELGPFTVTEGTLLYVAIDEREWGVNVSSYSIGCILSTWIE